jgi:hypothetical protein
MSTRPNLGFVAGVYGTVNIQPGIGWSKLGLAVEGHSGDAGPLRTKRPFSFARA